MTDTIIHIMTGGPIRSISVNREIRRFEMHQYCGPVLVDADDEPLEDQMPADPFWIAVSHWAQQGERVEDGLCRWDHPSEPITEHLGGRHYRVTGHTPTRPGS